MTKPGQVRSSDTSTLVKSFIAWKLFLLAIALGSSTTPSYDTSTSLALNLPPDHVAPSAFPASSSSLTDILAARLTRWDAIYFTQSASRGYVFEQEWAFGYGMPFVVSKVVLPLASRLGLPSPVTVKSAALGAIAVSHLSHLATVLVLYSLVHRLFPDSGRLALTTGLLHVLSPAGLFLSAPYAESLFAFLSFAGYNIYVSSASVPSENPTILRGLGLILSGALLGLATACRTNGMLNGIIFVVELFAALHVFVRSPRLTHALAVVPPTVGGALVGLGSVVPQAAAYLRYCSDASGTGGLRPWCTKLVPSIYNFVQEHYWNTGFLRYWTPGNIPLFFLAFPMLALMFTSSYKTAVPLVPALSSLGSTPPSNRLLLSLSLGQGLLALLALFSYHVQISTRLASAYPIWYVWVAQSLSSRSSGDLPRNVVMYMVLYAAIQGVLFASFLPPA
ncbi:hypothetical protein jhhlp_003108 [Lomentospora prolificans]|uniref:GPI mannosyltransferase 2 n=1 Tax=Lomentospora prolificans TaxID=41688 RepID=A0A2N3NFU5_9PEZI|nr:hypothetical protein jhhlp_003108 [Lomentospora prolificans]